MYFVGLSMVHTKHHQAFIVYHNNLLNFTRLGLYVSKSLNLNLFGSGFAGKKTIEVFVSPGAYDTSCQSLVVLAMSALQPDSPVTSDEECQNKDEWDFQKCLPEHGSERYVMALQLLGQDLTKAVPKKVQEEAITPLDVVPKSDLIIGRFCKTPTKERLLIPS